MEVRRTLAMVFLAVIQEEIPGVGNGGPTTPAGRRAQRRPQGAGRSAQRYLLLSRWEDVGA
jgi:hypothetical protein